MLNLSTGREFLRKHYRRAIHPSKITAPLLGVADLLTRNRVAGWAFDPDHPETPVLLEIMETESCSCRLQQITLVKIWRKRDA